MVLSKSTKLSVEEFSDNDVVQRPILMTCNQVYWLLCAEKGRRRRFKSCLA